MSSNLPQFTVILKLKIILFTIISTGLWTPNHANLSQLNHDINWIHQAMSDAQRTLLFGGNREDQSEPDYQIIQPQHIVGLDSYGCLRPGHRRLVKRDVTSFSKKSSFNKQNDNKLSSLPEKLSILFNVFSQNFNLTLTRNYNLISPNFKIKESFVKNSNQSADDLIMENADCFYQGTCNNHPNSSVALSFCDGMRGLIETSSEVYVINPVPSGLTDNPKSINSSINQSINYSHIVVKKGALNDYQCPHAGKRVPITLNSFQSSPPTFSSSSSSFSTSSSSPWLPLNRTRRSTAADGRESDKVTGITVETAVFIDETLYDLMQKTFPGDTEHQVVTYVLTIMNAVQLLFKQPSLGLSVNISIVLLDILKTQPKDLVSSDNIDTYLTNFCVWQHNKRTQGRGQVTRWDHALLLSGINMYVIDGQGRKKRHVVGLAPVSGMCNSLNSCTISEGTSFQTVLVAGHEMGHSLGMEHDGNQDGNSCDHDNFIMSPTLGAGKTSWSSCSRDYLEKFIKQPQASCVLTASSSVNILSQFTPESSKLPGQLFDADQQCVLRFGSDSRRSHLQPEADVCRLLRCDTGSARNIVAYHAHPALEGTHCGTDKWCREGKCVTQSNVIETSESKVIISSSVSLPETVQDQPEPSPIQWSDWSSYSSCSSECIVRGYLKPIGMMMSVRTCNQPTAITGDRQLSNGTCSGYDKRFKLCDASYLCRSMPHKIVDIEDYINEVCTMASFRDSTLKSTGTQYPGFSYTHSCYVWCHKRGGGLVTHGWKVPDGTPCGLTDSTRSNRFCFNGECRPFDCFGKSLESIETEACPEIAVESTIKSETSDIWNIYSGPWIPTSSCRYPCLSGSRGVRLVTRECNPYGFCHRKKDSFQLCSGSDETCPKKSIKSVEKYADDLCTKYQIKYPTLLSGKGRQLPPRPDNPHASCIIACQDRVWKDIHYQMDAFADGKFPLGTKCSFGSNSDKKAFCVNGQCVLFDDNNLPLIEEETKIENVKYLFGRKHQFQNRHRRSTIYNETSPSLSNRQQTEVRLAEHLKGRAPKRLPTGQWLPESSRRVSLTRHVSSNGTILSLTPYNWGIALSPCSEPCDGGIRLIHIYCHNGNQIVSDHLCDPETKPRNGKREACNTHSCSGIWRTEAWSQCSATCGHGFQTRSVVCVRKLISTVSSVYSLTSYDDCSRQSRPKQLRICNLPAC